MATAVNTSIEYACSITIDQAATMAVAPNPAGCELTVESACAMTIESACTLAVVYDVELVRLGLYNVSTLETVYTTLGNNCSIELKGLWAI